MEKCNGISLSSIFVNESAGARRVGNDIEFDGSQSAYVFCGPNASFEPGTYLFTFKGKRLGSEIGYLRFEVCSDDFILEFIEITGEKIAATVACVLPENKAINVRLFSDKSSARIHAMTSERINFIGASTLAQSLREKKFGAWLLTSVIHPFVSDPAPKIAYPSDVSPSQLCSILFCRSTMIETTLEQLDGCLDELLRREIDPVLLRALFEDGGFAGLTGGEESEPVLVSHPPTRNLFQDVILRYGCFSCVSPITGRVIESRSSIPLLAGNWIVTAYEFFDLGTPIVIIANSGWGGTISHVWFIEKDVVVTDQRTWSSGHVVSSLLELYFNICLSRVNELAEYRVSAKDVALTVGYHTNLGHYFWNDISGLERIFRRGALASPMRILEPPRIWISARDLYPQTAEITEQVTAEAMLDYVLRTRIIIVRPTGSAIDFALAGRVKESAERVIGRINASGHEATKRRLADAEFVLFVNLRVHNKTWMEQISGIISMIDIIRKRYERVLVYLDGMPDCAELADLIIRERGNHCEIVNGLEVPFTETLIWAYACDFFVAVIGSGLVPVTWLADKPGIVHSNRAHRIQVHTFWRLVRHSERALLSPALEEIMDLTDDLYTDYSIDIKVMEQLFIKGLDAEGF
jgi:hypothetical protein